MPGEDKLKGAAREIYQEIALQLGQGADPGTIIAAVVRAYAARLGPISPQEEQALITILTGIATQESGLDPNIQSQYVDPKTKQQEQSFGLFQANLKGRGTGFSPEELRDPILNTVLSVDEMFRPVLAGVRQGGIQGGVQAAAGVQRSADVAGQVQSVLAIISRGAPTGAAPSGQTVPATPPPGAGAGGRGSIFDYGEEATNLVNLADVKNKLFGPGDDLPSDFTMQRLADMRPLELADTFWSDLRAVKGRPDALKAPYVRQVLLSKARGEKIDAQKLILAIDDIYNVRHYQPVERPALAAQTQAGADATFLKGLPSLIAQRRKMRQAGQLGPTGAPTSQEAAQEAGFLQ
ncbi:MAG TPA: hypothetical protein VJA25_08140 [Dehalococcoidia bacterium]|nr:hypothetical protein [Dehalococcoidia bacterium]